MTEEVIEEHPEHDLPFHRPHLPLRDRHALEREGYGLNFYTRVKYVAMGSFHFDIVSVEDIPLLVPNRSPANYLL